MTNKFYIIYSKSGFTFTELLVVVSIIAIMVVLAIPAYNSYEDQNALKNGQEAVQSALTEARSLAMGPKYLGKTVVAIRYFSDPTSVFEDSMEIWVGWLADPNQVLNNPPTTPPNNFKLVRKIFLTGKARFGNDGGASGTSINGKWQKFVIPTGKVIPMGTPTTSEIIYICMKSKYSQCGSVSYNKQVYLNVASGAIIKQQ